jgi:hypothetical protein
MIIRKRKITRKLKKRGAKSSSFLCNSHIRGGVSPHYYCYALWEGLQVKCEGILETVSNEAANFQVFRRRKFA